MKTLRFLLEKEFRQLLRNRQLMRTLLLAPLIQLVAGQSTTINLFQLYLQQYRIFGSFGASMRNIRDSLDKMAAGLLPVIDTEVPLAEFDRGLARLESRQVFGKIIVLF